MQKHFIIILLFICSAEFSCQQNSIQPTTTLVRVEKTMFTRTLSNQFDTAYTTYLIQPDVFLDSIRNTPDFQSGALSNIVVHINDSLLVQNNSDCYSIAYNKGRLLWGGGSSCSGWQYTNHISEFNGFFLNGKIDSLVSSTLMICSQYDCHDYYYNFIKYIYQNDLLERLDINLIQSSIYYNDDTIHYQNELNYQHNYVNPYNTLGFDVNDVVLNANFLEEYIFNGLISYDTKSKYLIEKTSLLKLNSTIDARKEVIYTFDEKGAIKSFTIKEYHNNILEFISIYNLVYE